MNVERLSGHDSQWERSLQLFPLIAAQPHVPHCHVINEPSNYFTKLTLSQCLINAGLFWPIDGLRWCPTHKWAWALLWRFLPPGATWSQIEIIKQELSLGALSSEVQKRGGTDGILHLQPKQPTIILCKHAFNLIFATDTDRFFMEPSLLWVPN